MRRTPILLTHPAQEATMTITKAKKAAPKVAVYDASGNLVGLVDAEAITAVASPTSGPQPQHVSPADKSQAELDRTAAEVNEQMSKALYGLAPRAAAIRKSSIKTDEGWGELLKSVDSTREARVKQAVSGSALKLMLAGVPEKDAVRICKQAAVRVALVKGLL